MCDIVYACVGRGGGREVGGGGGEGGGRRDERGGLTSSRLSPARHIRILFPFLSTILEAFSAANSEVKSNKATSFSPL